MTADVATGNLNQTFSSIARGLGSPALVTLPLPAAPLRRVRAMSPAELLRNAAVAWRPADSDEVLLGFGREVSVHGRRESTIADAAAAARPWMAMDRISEVPPALQPSFFGGARFGGDHRDPSWDAFGGWDFTIPRVLLSVAADGDIAGSVTLAVEPGETVATIEQRLALPLSSARAGVPHGPAAAAAGNDDAAWCNSVAEALREIAARKYEKVVLARPVRVEAGAAIDEGRVLARLAAAYRSCYVFKATAGGSAWLGASPELLCRVSGGVVETVALAGSAPRGKTPEEDAALARSLLADAKERHEHALVVLALKEGLTPFCGGVDAPAEPDVFRVRNIQHLRTPISGRLHHHAGIIDVVAALHPSPAVGGWPRAAARDAIERLEGMDRGWYAGPVGRLGLDGDGEFAVALRSALVQGNSATLYAGAGIVEGSDPGRELAETRTKLQPLLEAIGES